MKAALVVGFSTLLILIADQAQSADAFNLTCSGRAGLTAVQGVTNARIAQAKPFSSVYRLDLTNKKWCAAGCGAINPIVSITPDQIILHEAQPNGGQALTFDRASKQLSGQLTIVQPAQNVRAVGRLQATCAQSPFSGFPTSKP